eukprot:scaffold22613_cov126-Cylindrotheca_fusiformis.AAC.1
MGDFYQNGGGGGGGGGGATVRSLEYDLDAILQVDSQSAARKPTRQPTPAARAPPPPPSRIVPPRVINARPRNHDFDDDITMSTLDRDQTVFTMDEPPLVRPTPEAGSTGVFPKGKGIGGGGGKWGGGDIEAPSHQRLSPTLLKKHYSAAAGKTLKDDDFGEDHDGYGEKPQTSSGRRRFSFKELYIAAFVMSLVLLAVIVGLAVWFITIRAVPPDENQSQQPDLSQPQTAPPTSSPTSMPINDLPPIAPSPSSTLSPTQEEPTSTVVPTVGTTTTETTPSPSLAPSKVASFSPTTLSPTTLSPTTLAPTTLSPTEGEPLAVQQARSRLSNLLSDRGAVIPSNNDDTSAPRYQAMEWLIQRIQLTRNSFEGTIPTELGQLHEDLVFLGLGRNNLIGALPTEMGHLTRLRTIGLERNQFSSTIPTEFGRMTDTERLNLDRNELTGTIPLSLQQLTNLEGLNVSFNNQLQGSVPQGVCNRNLDYLEADCEFVTCNCCTKCHSFN